MTDNRIWLGGLLLAQLALAGGLYWSHLQAGDVAPEAPLLSAAAGSVDRLVIGDGSQQVELERAGEGWALVDSGLPADGARVDGALERLASTTTGWPVTTTNAAHRRFEVDEDDYQRRLQAFAGGQPADQAALAPVAARWEREVAAAFCASYAEGVAGCCAYPDDPGAADDLVELFVLEKALYEINYEINHRPSWVSIPVRGVLALCRKSGSGGGERL